MEQNHLQDIEIDNHEVQMFLSQKLSSSPTDVTLIGEGAWSRCFGYSHDGKEFVIRFGKHVEDFEKDQRAFQFAGPNLPIPEVREIGAHRDLYYAISTRVHGVPLESISGEKWRAVIPSLVSAMEAMRTADLPSTSGMGGWGQDGRARWATWSQHLLAVAADTPNHRTYGWRRRLATSSSEGEATFRWGYNLLTKVVRDSVPRSLLHCDLINRNVFVTGNHLSGIFDWGCSIYGDHLYELAWFEFWAPWYPQLDVSYLRSALEKRWRDEGYALADRKARLMACYLHIGLDHLAYNAYLGDWSALTATAERMRALIADMRGTS